MQECNFDGIVGPTHQYGGLSYGNVASFEHAGEVGNPRAAALQGLEKMRFLASLGVLQAVLPPHPRPELGTLRRLGFSGSDAEVLKAAERADPHLLTSCSSASAMWTANAATVAPSTDTADGRLHFTVANLCAMFHRSLEAPVTARLLRRIFASEDHFVVHEPLPASITFSDEGAANHLRLHTSQATVHLFAWGRHADASNHLPRRYPARQSLEASQAVARLHSLSEAEALFWQQCPEGIDAGAFHSDVLASSQDNFLMLHEQAFVDHPRLLDTLQRKLGPQFEFVLASEEELPTSEAVAAYPFNSQVVRLKAGKLAIVAPAETEQSEQARGFLERVIAEVNSVQEVHYLDVNASMRNGGGPACLRLRVPLTDAERAAVRPRVFLDDTLSAELEAWIRRHYRDRLSLSDLADPLLLREVQTALDALSSILGLGSVYDFQQA
jgi:succinylarginine dihydrolase